MTFVDKRDDFERLTVQDLPVQASTLGDVLYAKRGRALIPESEWVGLVRSAAAGEQAGLHGLYDRAHRLVYTLAVRISRDHETAEEITLDVFHDVWRRAGSYDPENGTVLGWIMNQARSRALDRWRFDRRKKRVAPEAEEFDEGLQADPCDLVELNQRKDAVRAALAAATPEEREAIELAFFSNLTHVEIAARLKLPLGTVKTRIRSGLHKVRQAMAEEGR